MSEHALREQLSEADRIISSQRAEMKRLKTANEEQQGKVVDAESHIENLKVSLKEEQIRADYWMYLYQERAEDQRIEHAD